MKFHKTFKSDRRVYSYEFTNEHGEISKITIEPSENGITDIEVNLLHSFDDAEVYNNRKNANMLADKERQIEKTAWRKEFIHKFEEEHGYSPDKETADYEVRNHFNNLTTVSIDAVSETLGGDEPGFLAQKSNDDSEAVSERIHELLEPYPKVYTEIYEQVVLNSYVIHNFAHDFAESHGIKEYKVRTIAKEIREIIKKDSFLRKFFRFSEKTPRNFLPGD